MCVCGVGGRRESGEVSRPGLQVYVCVCVCYMGLCLISRSAARLEQVFLAVTALQVCGVGRQGGGVVVFQQVSKEHRCLNLRSSSLCFPTFFSHAPTPKYIRIRITKCNTEAICVTCQLPSHPISIATSSTRSASELSTVLQKQCVVVCRSELQCVAVCYSLLQCVAV